MTGTDPERQRCIIIGAGPAGLTAAYELSELGASSIVLEQDAVVGGIARTVEYKGYRFDIGGHRFFTKVRIVQEFWNTILGGDLQVRSRLSRIHYNGRFFDYPLRPLNALRGLGLIETLRITASYVRARVFPALAEVTFEDWVCNRFGRRLFEIFFKTYTEKVWGMKCSEISADWAAQRIKNLDLVTALKDMVVRHDREVTTLIRQFHYPRLGPGMMWERVAAILEGRGVPIRLRHRVSKIHVDDGRVVAVTAVGPGETEARLTGQHFISTMPIQQLIAALSPPPPPNVLEASRKLRYRDFLTVGLIVGKPDLFKDNWVYIHSPDVKVGRIQNFKNWSPEMVPVPSQTTLGLEYFLQEADALWTAKDEAVIEMAVDECVKLGFIEKHDVLDAVVIRMPKAYPVYDGEYETHLASIKSYLAGIANLQLVGRNGQHRYNNQDHSMLTAIYAARNILGSKLDIWDVNLEPEYHEAGQGKSRRSSEPLVPRRNPSP